MPNSIVIGSDGQARDGTYSASRVSPAPSPVQPAPQAPAPAQFAQPPAQPAPAPAQPAPGPAAATQDPRALVNVSGNPSRQVQVEGQPEAIREVIKDELEPELRQGLDADAEADRLAREDAVNAALPEGHDAAWEKAIGNVQGILEGTSLEPETLLSLVARGQPIGDADMAAMAERAGGVEQAQAMLTQVYDLVGQRADAVISAQCVTDDRMGEFQKYLATQRGSYVAALNELVFKNDATAIASLARMFVSAGQADQPVPVGQQSITSAYTWPNGEVAHVKRGAWGQPDLVIMNGMEVPVEVAVRSYGLQLS